MEIATIPLESQAIKLKNSLLELLQTHPSPDGTVSLMKLTCDEEIEAQMTIFVCQQLIDEFINAAVLPMVIVPAKNDISPLQLAIMLKAFYLACEECGRYLHVSPGDAKKSFFHQAQRYFDGKTAEDVAQAIKLDMEQIS